MSVQGFTVYDVLVRNAQATGEGLALVDETGRERSHRALLDRVDSLATGLVAAGLAAGERVAVLAQNSGSYFELYLAAARVGAVVYPLNWRLSAAEIERILERAGPRALVVEEGYLDVLPKAVDEIPLRLQLDGTPGAGYRAFDSVYEDPAPITAEVQPDDPFAIIATAAVDVVPRGAVLTHRNVLASNLQQLFAMGLTPQDRNLLALPLFHIAGLGHAMALLHAGGANVLMRRFDAAAAVKLIDRHRVSYLSDFPPVLTQLLDAAAEAGSSLESLRFVSGLDSPETMERLHAETRADFWTGFGQTETSGFVTFQRARDRMACAGKPGAFSRVKLVDDYDREVEAGQPGEILVRGPVVFAGYDGQPEVTEQTFRGGWHHTGDVGRFDEEGNLYYVRRKPEKELIKPGGENVYPAEVETVIAELPQVTAVCVFGVPDEKWGEAIKAVVEVAQTESRELTPTAVIDHVAARIARYKKPHHVELTSALPRDEGGAVDRDAVKARWG